MIVKFLYMAWKSLLEVLRDKRGFAFLLGFPALIIVIFAFAFGSGTFLSGGAIPHEVAVVNYDAGVTLTLTNTTSASSSTQYINYGTNFTTVLANATTEDTGTHFFTVNNVSEGKARDLLKSRNIDALIIIPENFSSAFATVVNNTTRTAITSSIGEQTVNNTNTMASTGTLEPIYDSVNGTYAYVVPSVKLPQPGNVSSLLTVEGDSGYINFATSQVVLSEIFDHFKNDVRTQAMTAASSPGTKALFNDTIPLKIRPMLGTQSFTLFDYMVPGLIVLALLLQTDSVSGSLAREIKKGTLDRLKLSKARSFDLLFGTLIVWTFISVIQLVILTGVAIVVGYHHQGDLSSLALAVLISMIAGMASISLALIIASFAKSEQQAQVLSLAFATVLAWLAGSFIQLPRQVLGEFGGRTYQIYDILPWTHAISALRGVLTYGSGLSPDVAFDVMWLIILTTVLFVIGVVTYSRARLGIEK